MAGVIRNTLRMPFAEWLGKMSAAKLEQNARLVAIYAAVFEISGNGNLMEITGIKSDKTIWKIKKLLLDEGWVTVQGRTGGRGHGSTITPAFKETPVTFTDLSPRNPGKYYVGSEDETYVTQGRGLGETYVNKPMVSVVGVSTENQAKSSVRDETYVTVTSVLPSRAHATKESTIVDSYSLSGEGETYAAEAKRTKTVIVNGEAIYGPGFILPYAAIDMAAAMLPMEAARARQIAEICAQDWTANKTVPQNPMAMVRSAITNDHRQNEIHGVRMAKAKAPYQAQPEIPKDAKKKYDAIVGKRS